jgi:cytochrome bd-type quinol oxidase subunit 2
VTIEIIVLAMASTIRPTSLAATYALLEHKSRRVLMLAYVVGGLAFTIAFGLVVVYAFHGIHLHAGTGRTKAIAEIIGGAVALAFGLALLTGHVHGRDAQEAPAAGGRLKEMLDQHVTTRIAVLAGPATHIPGIFYLIALNVIVAHNPRVTGGALDVVTYNAVWYALPILALVLCMMRPAAARDAVGSVDRWALAHSRSILLWVSLIVGAALVVRGALTL